MSAQAHPFETKTETMFFIFARELTGGPWYEQESSEDESDIRYYLRRNSARNAQTYSKGCGREYVAVKRVSTYEALTQ